MKGIKQIIMSYVLEFIVFVGLMIILPLWGTFYFILAINWQDGYVLTTAAFMVKYGGDMFLAFFCFVLFAIFGGMSIKIFAEEFRDHWRLRKQLSELR